MSKYQKYQDRIIKRLETHGATSSLDLLGSNSVFWPNAVAITELVAAGKIEEAPSDSALRTYRLKENR
jgi:hypothetical protein